jgi:hypothetical protein
MAFPTSVNSQITDAVTAVNSPISDDTAAADPADEHDALAQTIPAERRLVIKDDEARGTRTGEVGRVTIVEVVEKAGR